MNIAITCPRCSLDVKVGLDIPCIGMRGVRTRTLNYIVRQVCSACRAKIETKVHLRIDVYG